MANIVTISPRKSQPDGYRDPRVKHVEDWVRVSSEARVKVLGENAFAEAEALYSLKGPSGEVPSFRPSVSIPELQKITLEDANRISDVSPQVFIFSESDRDQDREKALQAEWQRARVNYHMLYAALSARYVGTGFIQLCYSPDLRNGRGGMWVKSRNPASVFVDPSTDYEWDPAFIGWEDWMNVEEVRKQWPLTSKNVKPRAQASSNSTLLTSDAGYGIQMPPGPMNSIPGMSMSSSLGSRLPSDSRVLVRHVFCKDYTREIVEERGIPDGSIVDPEFMWKYPNGRWLVECEGYILSDGDNPFPERNDIPAPHFPLFPVWALPPLYGPWGVPAIKLSQTLQSMAEKMYTQLYENSIRLNNGTWFIDSNTGIDPEAFGGMPGEVQTINPNTRVPECKTPPALPANASQFPAALLDLQRKLHGQTDARQGNPGAGNISVDLFDASVLQSSGLLQLAGRIQSFTISQLASCMFYTMGRYMGRRSIPYRSTNGMEVAQWKGILRPDQYDFMLDETSIEPLSDAVIRKMVPELMKTGVLSTKRGLEALNFPHADEVAEEQRQNLELAALAKVRGAKK